MAISRNLMERQMRNMGGLMTLDEPRQGYFLGKIVRKAKKAVKIVVKSPIGKAAILGAGIYGLGGGFGSSGFDYEFDALGAIDNPDNVGLTEEEQEALDNVQNVGFTPGQAFGAFGQTLAFGPFSGLLSARRSLKANEQAAIEAAKEAAAQADFERAMANQKGFYASLNEGAGASVSDKSREEAGPGFGDVSESGSFMDGGIVDLVDIYD